MDALSDVLRAVRLTGAVFFDVQACAPWVAETPVGTTIVDSIFPGAEHLMSYHVVTRGIAWACVPNEPPIRLSAGDVIVFPHGDAHAMSSAPGMRKPPDLALFRLPDDGQLPFALSMGAEKEEPVHIVCGFFGCDARPFNPLLTALPRVIHVSGPGSGAVGAFAEFAADESKARRPGGDCVLGHLSELMFVDVVRRYLEALPAERSNWLAALREPYVGRALAALHRNPARPWTLELLAREVALSRSALAERFTAFVGQPPMQYLASWRMQLAANQLRSGGNSVALIAERVGYESEAAFSRAFKKAVGTPPSRWRRTRREGQP
jgi:AraC-like DNA-binding protein